MIVETQAPQVEVIPAKTLGGLLQESGQLAADALTAWAAGGEWTQELTMLRGTLHDLCQPRAPEVRSLGMDTYGEMAGCLVLYGPAEALKFAGQLVGRDPNADDEQLDAAVLEIANVLGSAYLNALRDNSGIVSNDPRTFLPSPPGWHRVPVSVVFHLALCGQGNIHDGIVAHHVLHCGLAELNLVWVPSFLAIEAVQESLIQSPTRVSGVQPS